MKIKLVKSDVMDDWFLIVRAEHDGKEWEEELPGGGHQHMLSERLHPAGCLEGDAETMVSIANAIKSRATLYFSRVAVVLTEGGFHFQRPKNSAVTTFITFEEADELAEQILSELNVN